MEITELSAISDIEAIENQYSKKYGHNPLNISWWDPSDYTKTDFLNLIDLAKLSLYHDPISYHFSYDLDCSKKILESFGFYNKNKTCLITPTGSTSLLCVINWIKNSLNRKRIITLSPHYFSVSYNAVSLGIEVKKQYIERDENGYIIKSINCGIKDVIWITNPIYCTGVLYNSDQKKMIKKILEKGVIVVADECLASPGKELSHEYGDYPNFIGIYCPHKTICVNGIKFSAVVFDKKYENYFEQWSDILYGCLSISNNIAIEHFLSGDFKIYEERFHSKLAITWKYLKELCSKYPKVSYDIDSSGYLRTLFIPTLDAIENAETKMLWEILNSSGTSLIPSIRNHFSPNLGFGFRINLALESPIFRSSLDRLLRTLSGI